MAEILDRIVTPRRTRVAPPVRVAHARQYRGKAIDRVCDLLFDGVVAIRNVPRGPDVIHPVVR